MCSSVCLMSMHRGNFAVVKRAEHKETGTAVAIKIIDKKVCTQKNFVEREVPGCLLAKI